MTVATEEITAQFNDVVVGVPLNCDFPCFDQTHVTVLLGLIGELAVLNTDYTVQLNSTGGYVDFTVTPLLSMRQKIDAILAANPDEQDLTTVTRDVPLTTDMTPTKAQFRQQISDEFDRSVLRDQQINRDADAAIRVPETRDPEFDTTFAPLPDTIPIVSSDGLRIENVKKDEVSGPPGPEGPPTTGITDQDTTPDYLDLKLVLENFGGARSNALTRKITSPGGNEKMELAAPVATDPEIDAGVSDEVVVTARGAKRAAEQHGGGGNGGGGSFGCLLRAKSSTVLELAAAWPNAGVWINGAYRSLAAGAAQRGTTYPEIGVWGAATLNHIYALWDDSDPDENNHFVYLDTDVSAGWVWNDVLGYWTRDTGANAKWTAVGAARTTGANEFSHTDLYLGVRSLYNEPERKRIGYYPNTVGQNVVSNNAWVPVPGFRIQAVLMPYEEALCRVNVHTQATNNNDANTSVGSSLSGNLQGGTMNQVGGGSMAAATTGQSISENAVDIARMDTLDAIVYGDGTVAVAQDSPSSLSRGSFTVEVQTRTWRV